MQVYGTCGRSSRHYAKEGSVLNGLLTSDDHRPVYPSNYCEKCVAEGKELDTCFHNHWEAT